MIGFNCVERRKDYNLNGLEMFNVQFRCQLLELVTIVDDLCNLSLN